MLLESFSTKPVILNGLNNTPEPQIITSNDKSILNTTKLFEFLINNLNENKCTLAAIVQMYI